MRCFLFRLFSPASISIWNRCFRSMLLPLCPAEIKKFWFTFEVRLAFNALCETYLHEEIVAAGNAFHDMPFDFIIFQNGQTIVDQNRWMCCFKVGAEIGWWLLHINCCDLIVICFWTARNIITKSQYSCIESDRYAKIIFSAEKLNVIDCMRYNAVLQTIHNYETK